MGTRLVAGIGYGSRVINPSARFAIPNLETGLVHFGGFDAPYELAADFVVVDVETTSFNAQTGRIIEFAAHRTSGDGAIIASYSTLVNPGSIDTGAVHVHGITADMLTDAPTWSQILPSVMEFMSGGIFVAHHALFDAAFVYHESVRSGVNPQLMPGVCTVWLAKQAFPELDRHNLDAVSARLGLANAHAHAATSDAQVVVEALPAMLAAVNQIKHYVLPHDVATHNEQLAFDVIPVKNR